MLGALFMPPAPTWPVSIPSGPGAKAGLRGPPPPRMPVGWEMNFESQAAFEKAPRGGIASIRAGAGLFKLAERGHPGSRCRWPSARQLEPDLEEPFPLVPGIMALEVRKTALLVDQINYESEADSLIP